MMSEPTETWEHLPLTDERRRHTLRYLDNRRSGANAWIWFTDQPSHLTYDRIHGGIQPGAAY